MLWTDKSDINSLIVTLSLSPSMMLLGVRSRWMIRFSLCKYLKARQICGGFSMNLFHFYSYFPCSVQVFELLTCMKMFQTLSSVNVCRFSLRELKCSARGAPSMSSITMKSLSAETKTKKDCFKSFVFIWGQNVWEYNGNLFFLINYSSKKSLNII